MLKNLFKSWAILAPDEIKVNENDDDEYCLAKTKTWDVYTDIEFLYTCFALESTFQDILQGYLQRCIEARGWEYEVYGNSIGRNFKNFCVVSTGDYSTGEENKGVLINLLTAYVTALAAQRTVSPGTWLHFKGDMMQVIGRGPWDGSGLTVGVLVASSSPQIFSLEESPNIKVYLNQYDNCSFDYSFCVAEETEKWAHGDRVFYTHDGQNWARKTDNFLGLVGSEHPEHEGLLRFVEVAG